ncbi:hypothetical protein LY76DRAFT_595360 [Colletotrichum caudatum]|nr:hypothetical protein LY76DRAFT_595360 [Colletotrichum caudatum]
MGPVWRDVGLLGGVDWRSARVRAHPSDWTGLDWTGLDWARLGQAEAHAHPSVVYERHDTLAATDEVSSADVPKEP